MNEKLYTNAHSDNFGSTVYIGTLDEWKNGMDQCLLDWFDETDPSTDDDYEEWVEDQLDKNLRLATDEEIATYPRIVD